jgi:hypothetical protein
VRVASCDRRDGSHLLPTSKNTTERFPGNRPLALPAVNRYGNQRGYKFQQERIGGLAGWGQDTGRIRISNHHQMKEHSHV